MTCTEFQKGAVLRNTQLRAQTTVTLRRLANADFIGAQARATWGQAQLEIIEEKQPRPTTGEREAFPGVVDACLWPWSLFVEAAIGGAVGDRVVARGRPMRRSKVELLNTPHQPSQQRCRHRDPGRVVTRLRRCQKCTRPRLVRVEFGCGSASSDVTRRFGCTSIDDRRRFWSIRRVGQRQTAQCSQMKGP